jgi:predicted nucleic acid-binding protein
MILVDTSVWVDHLRRHNAGLADLLSHGRVVVHPFVIGEVFRYFDAALDDYGLSQ